MTGTMQRPVVPFINTNGVPTELRALHQWIGWRYELRDDVWSKIPLNPNRKPSGEKFPLASTTNRATWTDFDTAVEHAEYYGLDGVGFVFTADDPYVGIDLDHVRDAATGEIEEWARNIVETFGSFSEISVSGSGVHILVKGVLPGHGLHRGQVEIYDQGRYFTMSGRVLVDVPIEERQEQVEALYGYLDVIATAKAEPTPAPPSSNGNGHVHVPTSLSDEEVMSHAENAANGDKFKRLMAGDTTDYGGDDSAADAALCSMLLFWAGGDRTQTDRLFRTSGLMRPKWDSRQPQPWGTYGVRTIEFAAKGKNQFYIPVESYQIIAPPRPVGTADPEDDESFHRTDYGNAERLARAYGDDLRFVASFGKWLYWDGTRFAVDQDEAVMRLAKGTIRQIYAEASALEDRSARIALVGHAKRSESIGRLHAMVTLAQSESAIAIRADQLDLDPWLLNVQNGTLDLRTGVLRARSRDDLITKLAPVPYHPQSVCPIWESFLTQVLPSEEVRQFVQRAFGYSLTGLTTERIVLILYGMGANGKSTFLDVCRQLLGDYALTTPSETFLAKREGGIPNDVARLKGARFVTAVEADENKRLAEAMIKQMAGGAETISARFMRGEWFEFYPEFKVWLATNHKPIIRGTDDGIWDRIRLISFPVRIPEKDQDKSLGQKLRAELPGILAWAVRGCLAWQQGGLGVTEEVRQATNDYRAEMDILNSFIDDQCDVEPGSRVAAGPLYKSYTSWCEATGERPMTQTSLGKRLREKGFVPFRDGSSRWWEGLYLKQGASMTRLGV